MLKYIDIGNGIPLLLIHGLGSRKESWEPQYELSDTYRLIIPDIRGHGETLEDQNLTMENYAKDIIELLKYLNLTSVYITGLSLGGIIAQEVYKQQPDLVKGLILANTTYHIPSIFRYGLIKNIESVLKQGKDKLIETIANRGLHNKDRLELARESFYIRDCYLEASQSSIGCNYTNTLMSVDKPVLLIGSIFDKVTPIFNTYIMRFLLKKSDTVILNTGHLSNIENSKEFNKSIRSFIERNEKNG